MFKGDSGGPLTTVNEEGAHILVGIVSKRLGGACNQKDYAVFTNVSALLPWVEFSIKEYGGMASCSFNFSALPTVGGISEILFQFKQNITVLKKYENQCISNYNKKSANTMQEYH